jgi:hypothetical protein
MSTLVAPDEVLTDGVPAAPAKSEICPYCGAHFQAGPEGAAWLSHFHCWRCGFDPGRVSAAQVAAGGLPAFGPGVSAQFAQQLAAQVHAALGLPEGTNLGDVIKQVQAAQAPSVAVTS